MADRVYDGLAVYSIGASGLQCKMLESWTVLSTLSYNPLNLPKENQKE